MNLFTHPLDRGPWNDGPAFEDWLTPDAAPPIARRHLCFGGGKSGTSTQQQTASVGPPQAILDRLNSVWNTASSAAAQPFQSYSGQFVAPINDQQSTGISGINDASGLYAPYGADATSALTAGAAGAYPYFNAATGSLNQGLGAGQALTGQSLGTLNNAYSNAQPYNAAATGLTLAGAGAANPTALNSSAINQYLSPYLSDVVSSTLRSLQQQQGQEQSSLAGNAIQSGAYGGDRAGVAAANLAQQQDIATGQTVSGILNQGYNTALSTAQQQQGVGLSAQQANLARVSGAGQQLAGLGAQQYGQGAQTAQQQAALASQLFGQGLGASQQQQALGQGVYNIGQGVSQGLSNLGTTAQTNALGAAQAQVGAGTLQQQTQQAQDTAQYNQFLQQQAYPFQTAQFLANVAQGTSPLYGTTTSSTGTATQPMPFFKRGGAVHDLEMDDGGEWRVKRAGGGGLSGADDLAQLIAAQGQMYLPRAAGASGPYGAGLSAGAPAQLQVAHLTPMQTQRAQSGLGDAMRSANQAVDFGTNIGKAYSGGKDVLVGSPAHVDAKGNVIPATSGWFGKGGKWDSGVPSGGLGGASSVASLDPSGGLSGGSNYTPDTTGAADLIPSDSFYRSGGRVGLAYGGMPYSAGLSDPIVPEDIADPVQVTRPLEYAGGMGLGAQSPQQSTLGQLGKGASAVSSLIDLGSTIASFFNRGGRIGKEGGGALGDPVALAAAPAEDPRIERARKAISQIEASGPNYGTLGPEVQMPDGSTSRAHGAYGVMDFNIPGWTKEALGRSLTPQEFLKDSSAQDAVFKHRFSKYLAESGNPQDAASLWFSGKPQAEAGNAKDQLGTTVPAYVQKFNKYYGADDSPTSLMPGNARDMVSMRADPAPDPRAPGSKQGWLERESGGLSGAERGIISLLSGLGGMASSPSRFLSGAILSGLGAGANTYGNLAQKGLGLDISQQQANTAQGQLGIAQAAKNIEVYNILRERAAAYVRQGLSVPKQLTDQMGALFSTFSGGVSASPGAAAVPRATDQVALPPSRAPISVAPLPPVQQAMPTPSVPASAPPEQTAAASGINDPEFFKKVGATHPVVMRQKAQQLAQMGDPEGAKDLEKQAQVREDQWNATGKATDASGRTIDVPGWSEQQASVGRVGSNQKWLDEQAGQAMKRSQAKEQLDTIKGILENFESGSMAGKKAQVQALANSLGVGGLTPSGATMNAAEYQKFMKATMQNVFANVSDMGGHPLATAIEGQSKATASPELQPQANKEILAQLYGRLNQAEKYYGDLSAELSKNKSLDRGAFTDEWRRRKENDMAAMVEDARKDLAVRGATPAPKDMKEGHTYIIEPGQFPGYEGGKYRLGRKEGKLMLLPVN